MFSHMLLPSRTPWPLLTPISTYWPHTAHIGHLEEDEAARRTLLDAHVAMVSTLAVFISHFDANNQPLFCDGCSSCAQSERATHISHSEKAAASI